MGEPIFIPKFEKTNTNMDTAMYQQISTLGREFTAKTNGIVSISSCGSRRFRWNKGK